MHRQYKLNQQAAQTDPLMTGLSLSAQGHVRLSPLIVVTAHRPGQAPPFTAAPTSTMRSWLSMRGAPTGPLQLGDSTSEKSNPSWPSFVNEHTQGARSDLQSLFRILRRPRNDS